MRLMIIGSLGGQLVAASKIATARGAKVFHVSDIKSALHALRSGKGADLLMIDVEQDIRGLVESLKQEHICVPVVACGINPNQEKAVQAIKFGAKEYIPLPPDEELIAAVFEAISGEGEKSQVIYNSRALEKVMEIAKRVATSEASILITGESGTGKEVMARFIHQNSKRKDKDLISINCAAIPENLLESELFGHEKGAFTGAIERRIGKFEEANGSTLLLDEISEMDLRLQAKLLRVLQEKEVIRVGGNKPIKLDIRVIATSNRDLPQEVRLGNFREDLFYRLNVINLNLPPLKDREEDINLLADHFIKKYSELNHIPVKELTNAALKKLQAYNWPGNVRELENTIHRTILLANDAEIDEHDIMLPENNELDSSSAEGTLENIEREAIQKALRRCYGDQSKAANVLGISVRILRDKLNQHKIAV